VQQVGPNAAENFNIQAFKGETECVTQILRSTATARDRRILFAENINILI
jgi:hypothetical protein